MNDPAIASSAWDIPAARNLYNIQRWGAKYFDINEAGRVVAMPLEEAGASVDITDVIEEAKGRGLKFPLLIRFQDILRHRSRRSTWRSGARSRNSVTTGIIAGCFRSRLINCARWWRRFWTPAGNITSVWKWGANRSCSPASLC